MGKTFKRQKRREAKEAEERAARKKRKLKQGAATSAPRDDSCAESAVDATRESEATDAATESETPRDPWKFTGADHMRVNKPKITAEEKAKQEEERLRRQKASRKRVRDRLSN